MFHDVTHLNVTHYQHIDPFTVVPASTVRGVRSCTSVREHTYDISATQSWPRQPPVVRLPRKQFRHWDRKEGL